MDNYTRRLFYNGKVLVLIVNHQGHRTRFEPIHHRVRGSRQIHFDGFSAAEAETIFFLKSVDPDSTALV
jgi:hypothetical protein